MSAFAARAEPDRARVWAWFLFQQELLIEARNHVTSRAGNRGPLRSFEARFLGLKIADVERFFDEQEWELEMVTSLELLSTVEAVLRIDLGQRVHKRLKDSVTGRFRALDNPNRARLDEDILEAWSTQANVKVGEFRGALHLRNWLAHGRFWHPKLGRGYDAVTVNHICQELLESIAAAAERL